MITTIKAITIAKMIASMYKILEIFKTEGGGREREREMIMKKKR